MLIKRGSEIVSQSSAHHLHARSVNPRPVHQESTSIVIRHLNINGNSIAKSYKKEMHKSYRYLQILAL